MKYQVGDNIKFIGKKAGDTIPDYEVTVIPTHLIIHGNTVLDKNYDAEFVRITDIYEDYYIVEFQDNHGNKVRLGFKEKILELVRITNW